MDDLLLIQNIVLAYENAVAVDHLSLTIHPGSLIGLIGPNGAGKTTLMLSMSGQFHPQSGAILFERQDIYKHNFDYKRFVGYVHETPFLYAHLTVTEFLRFIGRVKQMPKKEIEGKIEAMLHAVQLFDEREKLTSQLSQGMRQKLAIAAAMLNSPRLLFLDEALNGVDVESAFQIKKMLAEFVMNGGTVILSTHVLEVIEKICDRYVVLKGGRVVADLASDAASTEGLEAQIINVLKSSS